VCVDRFISRFFSQAKARGDCFKFGGGFYCARCPAPQRNGDAAPALASGSSGALSELPTSLMGGLESLSMGDDEGLDDAEKMLLFPESTIKAAIDTLKEVAILSVVAVLVVVVAVVVIVGVV